MGNTNFESAAFNHPQYGDFRELSETFGVGFMHLIMSRQLSKNRSDLKKVEG